MNGNFSVDNVVYLGHDNKDISLVMADGTILGDGITYYHVIRKLNDKFVRVNKNTIVMIFNLI